MACRGCQIRKFVKEAQRLHEAGDSLAAFQIMERVPLGGDTCGNAVFFKAKLAMAAELWPQALREIEFLEGKGSPKRALLLAKMECLVALGRQREARALAYEHEAIVGTCATTYSLQARISAALGQLEQTYTYLRAAIGCDPQVAAAHAFRNPELWPWAVGAFRAEPALAG